MRYSLEAGKPALKRAEKKMPPYMAAFADGKNRPQAELR